MTHGLHIFPKRMHIPLFRSALLVIVSFALAFASTLPHNDDTPLSESE